MLLNLFCLTEMLDTLIKKTAVARQVSAATVAFVEGMALFSIILAPDTFDFEQVLKGFQDKIIQSL